MAAKRLKLKNPTSDQLMSEIRSLRFDLEDLRKIAGLNHKMLYTPIFVGAANEFVMNRLLKRVEALEIKLLGGKNERSTTVSSRKNSSV